MLSVAITCNVLEDFIYLFSLLQDFMSLLMLQPKYI